MLFYRCFIKLGGFPLFDGDGILRALPQAGSEAVTVSLAD
jgi:hypothetical protein